MSRAVPAPVRGKQTIGQGRVEVGRLGFGGSSLANLYRERSEAEVAATVAAAVEGGLRYFDTAPLYGFGLSERRLGLHLRDVPREQLVISSKIGRTLFPVLATTTTEHFTPLLPSPTVSTSPMAA